MKNKIFIIVFVILLAIGIYIWRQYSLAVSYDYKVVGLNFEKVGINRTTGEITFRIKNYSNLSGQVIDSSLKMFINDVFVSNLNISDTIVINGDSDFILPLKFDFEPTKILAIKNFFALQGIADPDRTKIAFNGYIRVKKGFFTVRIPIVLNQPLSWYSI